jgi:hypothetical protein
VDVGVNNPGTSAVLRTLSVPVGISVMAHLNVRMEEGAGGGLLYLSDPAASDQAASATVSPLSTLSLGVGAGTSHVLSAQARVRTNTSAQIRHRHGSSDASTVIRIATLGWIDTRGRLN